MSQMMQDFKNRREHKRFLVKDGVFALDSTRFGSILDISLGGLSLSSLSQHGWSLHVYDTGIILSENDIYLRDIPFRITSKTEMKNEESFSTIKIIRIGLKFGSLDNQQLTSLKNFIINKTSAEA
ncbi:MAG: PilZ domain-containing protein [Proteobacteria bacterium]|nr:PilZ domain-containing protein [Pseudomonadota bacterium]MBU1714447.1 PilZ domain-containing protein [Pseudomonadota bacterium]